VVETAHDSSKPMFRVTTSLEDGYVSQHVLAVTKALRGEYPAVVVCGPGPEPESGNDDPILQVRRVPLVRAVNPVHDARVLTRLHRLIAVEQPWLVETHMAKAGALGRLAALTSRFRPKTIHTFHCHALRDYFLARATRVYLEIERRLAPLTDRLVALTTQTKDECLSLGIGEPTQWRIVPFASDPEPPRVLRRQLDIREDAFVVGSFANRESDTGQAALLEAIRDTPDSHVVVGGGSDCRPTLEHGVRSSQLESRLHLAGWLTEIPGAMAEMDLVVLYGSDPGTPARIEEAAAVGHAVILVSTGGVEFPFREGRMSFRVPPDDPGAMASAIRQVRDDEPGRREMSEAARSFASRLALEPTLAALSELYSELRWADPARAPR
jgi:glycosyltransferase involved in cell wall biosynthesis